MLFALLRHIAIEPIGEFHPAFFYSTNFQGATDWEDVVTVEGLQGRGLGKIDGAILL
jgi:hypothetical protein